MKREEICRLLADKVNKLKIKENSLSELLPDVRLLYGETPFARTPVMYEPGIIILFSGHKIGYINERVFRYDANEYLLLTVPLPFECETYATSEVPLAGLRLNVDILQLQELMMVTLCRVQMEMSRLPEDLSDMQILQECRIVQQVTRRTRKLD